MILIGIVLILLGVCITVDSATEINNQDSQQPLEMPNHVIIVNGTTDIKQVSMAKTDGKIYTDKTVKTTKNKKKTEKEKKTPTVTITAKPSVRSGYAYKWYTTTWVDYCPHCHKYEVLYNAHKYPARFEQELTCKICGADYCGVVGKEKYSWSHYYLTKA